MLKKILLLSFALLLLGLSSAQAQFKLYVPSYEVEQGIAKIDVVVENAPSIGSLQFNLSYDTKMMEIVNVSRGTLTSNAMLVEKVDNRNGAAAIGIISLSGFSNNGSIATLYINVSGPKGSTGELRLSMETKGMLTDTKNKELALPVLQNGTIKVRGAGIPILWILVAVLLVVFIIIVVFLWLRKRKKSTANPSEKR